MREGGRGKFRAQRGEGKMSESPLCFHGPPRRSPLFWDFRILRVFPVRRSLDLSVTLLFMGIRFDKGSMKLATLQASLIPQIPRRGRYRFFAAMKGRFQYCGCIQISLGESLFLSAFSLSLSLCLSHPRARVFRAGDAERIDCSYCRVFGDILRSRGCINDSVAPLCNSAIIRVGINC